MWQRRTIMALKLVLIWKFSISLTLNSFIHVTFFVFGPCFLFHFRNPYNFRCFTTTHNILFSRTATTELTQLNQQKQTEWKLSIRYRRRIESTQHQLTMYKISLVLHSFDFFPFIYFFLHFDHNNKNTWNAGELLAFINSFNFTKRPNQNHCKSVDGSPNTEENGFAIRATFSVITFCLDTFSFKLRYIFNYRCLSSAGWFFLHLGDFCLWFCEGCLKDLICNNNYFFLILFPFF